MKVYYRKGLTKGLYEKCGFREIDAMTNLAGDTCVIYEREILQGD